MRDPGRTPRPDAGHRYVIGPDLGLKHDRTVLTLCHAEPSPDDPGGLPTVVRLGHDSGHHDDQAVTLGLAALALTERPTGTTTISQPRGPIARPIGQPTGATRRTQP